jgi:hypothetical protein
MGGQIQLATPEPGRGDRLHQGGKLRALAVTTRERSPQLPDVPAASEVLPGFENAGWFGLMAPAGTPAESSTRIYRDSAKILLARSSAPSSRSRDGAVANSPPEFAARSAMKRALGQGRQGARPRRTDAHRSRQVEEVARELYIRALKILPPDIKEGFKRLAAARPMRPRRRCSAP